MENITHPKQLLEDDDLDETSHLLA